MTLITSFPSAWCGRELTNKKTTRKVNSNEQTEKIQDEGNPFRHQRERRLQRDGGSVTIEGTGLADATGCTFICQDKAGEKHDTVFGAGDFTASADGTRIEISDDMLVGHMRNACSVAMSELDTEADATVKVTLADGTILTYSVAIGE